MIACTFERLPSLVTAMGHSAGRNSGRGAVSRSRPMVLTESQIRCTSAIARSSVSM